MIKLQAIIIDDEPLAINVIKNHISKIKELEIVSTFSNAIEASSYLQNNKVDLIFLDINMPILNGLNFLQTLHVKPFVVITTAHDEYALKSYALDVIDYLIKPISFPRFLKSVSRIISLSGNRLKHDVVSTDKPSIFVKVDKKKLQRIYINEILVVESLKDYIRIITAKGKYIIHRTLSSFTEELSEDKFIRIHRSFTVAIDKVDVVEGNSLEIAGVRYIIGRSYLLHTKKTILKNISSATIS